MNNGGKIIGADSYRKTAVSFAVPAVILLVLAVIGLGGCGQGHAELVRGPAGMIIIDTARQFETLERPPVPFEHDRHVRALKEEGNDCTTCHLRRPDGFLSQKFMRFENVSEDQVVDIYHDRCLACHKERIEAGKESGPTICGDCHIRDVDYVTAWVPIGFDKSLHQRHVEANVGECGRCHHKYDPETDTLVYVKGEESSCRECHKEHRVDDTPSLATAAHEACLHCHLTMPDSGPTDCAGCHDAERLEKIKVIENPPRFKRNQPDFVLLSASDQNLGQSKMPTVPFSHIGHEEFNNTCRVCHHEGMKACKVCHSLQGTSEGGGITLQTAMHSLTSVHSCIGCHDEAKADTSCAGCHAFMEQGRIPESACPTCHKGPKPDIVNSVRSRYTSLNQFRLPKSETRLSFKKSEIPDTVVIGILSHKYEPARMPHRAIFDRLLKNTEGNKIATYFHGREDILCQGCHHHSPVGQIPPLCENCHGKPFAEQNLYKPGLFAAYHQQCIGCHEQMEFSQPTECTKCHAEKTEMNVSRR